MTRGVALQHTHSDSMQTDATQHMTLSKADAAHHVQLRSSDDVWNEQLSQVNSAQHVQLSPADAAWHSSFSQANSRQHPQWNSKEYRSKTSDAITRDCKAQIG